MTNSMEIKLAIFASGAGSNAQEIINYFRNDPSIRISLIVSNREKAGVIDIARREQIPFLVINRDVFFGGDFARELKSRQIDFVVLAGFLWKLPPDLVAAYPNAIVNIHPALLPKYGGQGMYGHHVHEAVIANGEKESGITIHYVDELYDHGQIIFQATCTVDPSDTAESLAKKIHALEHAHFPGVIAGLLAGQNIVKRS